MAFFVQSVIDGDTFIVNPGWMTNGKTGNRVRIANFNAPELDAYGGQAAKQRLEALIGQRYVDLYTQAIDTYGRLVADVHLNGSSIVPYLL